MEEQTSSDAIWPVCMAISVKHALREKFLVHSVGSPLTVHRLPSAIPKRHVLCTLSFNLCCCRCYASSCANLTPTLLCLLQSHLLGRLQAARASPPSSASCQAGA